MTSDLAAKTVIVTGAAGGIGRGTALYLGSLGANVVVADIITDGGEETAAMVQSGRRCRHVRTY